MKVGTWCEEKRQELGSYKKVAGFVGIRESELARIKAGARGSKHGPGLRLLILFRDKSGGKVSSVSDWE